MLRIATGFGLGYSPIASGTFGALLGLPIAWGASYAPPWGQVLAAAGLCLVALPVCDRAEKILGGKDDGRIVADEYLTFMICGIGLPLREHPWLLAAAFVVSRICDIVKPFPARRLERLRGGAGIVLDDLVASLYALGILHLALYLFSGIL